MTIAQSARNGVEGALDQAGNAPNVARVRPRRLSVLIAAEGLIHDIAAALISDFEDFEMLPCTANATDLPELVKRRTPDVVLLGRQFGGASAVDLTAQLHDVDPTPCIVGIDLQLDEALVRDMLRLGANGYLVADSKPSDLRAALQCASEGRFYLCPSVAAWMVSQYIRPEHHAKRRNGNGNGVHSRPADTRPSADELTERERQILRLLSDGLSNKRIADELNVCVQTISTQRRKLMEKLQVDSMAALTKYAIAQGITSVDQTAAPDVLAHLS